MTDKEMLKEAMGLLRRCLVIFQGDDRLHMTIAKDIDALLKRYESRKTEQPTDLHYKNDDRPQRGMWAQGDYCCVCSQCGDKYYGDKRSTVCADCAYKDHPTERKPIEPFDELPLTLHNIRDKINEIIDRITRIQEV